MTPEEFIQQVDGLYLSTGDAARALGVTIKTMDNWSWRGDGPVYIKIGRERRYPAAEIVRWLESRQRFCEPIG